ncbi:MAG: glutamine--fructose-6-phosphate transaminase (isomerizing), partial [Erysipelotrichaceae bacterium]|nr:glutamine--fructose-6-phosphate transaminase (isomerizing) [Erysipelotrichaceae bacterium]
MCGVVGYIGENDAVEVLLEGLKRLEYRGYDSAGIAIIKDDRIIVRKCKGRLATLTNSLKKEPLRANIGIGHTRWATHGEPSDRNSHPHINNSGSIAVIHNGILENYLELKEWLINEKGISFRSDTDSEIIAHLIDHYYQDDLLNAIKMALIKMSGAYAIGVICTNEPDKIIAVRKDSPLIVGVSPNGNYVASDIPALLRYTKDIYLIENDEIVVLTKDKVVIYDSMHQIVDRALFKVDWDTDAAEKGGYAHFMMKEINEQPQAVANTLLRRIDQDEKLKLDIKNIDLTKIDKIYIVACGTAYHAGLVAKVAIEELADMPTEVELASEFCYRKNFITDRTLVIIISQSGETLDTLAALREAKKDQARILAIVNVVGSSVSREADDVIYTWAGPEIAVASTKAYTTQLVALYMIALHLARLKGKIDYDHYHKVIDLLKAMPDQISMILNDVKKIQQLADEQFNNES